MFGFALYTILLVALGAIVTGGIIVAGAIGRVAHRRNELLAETAKGQLDQARHENAKRELFRQMEMNELLAGKQLPEKSSASQKEKVEDDPEIVNPKKRDVSVPWASLEDLKFQNELDRKAWRGGLEDAEVVEEPPGKKTARPHRPFVESDPLEGKERL